MLKIKQLQDTGLVNIFGETIKMNKLLSVLLFSMFFLMAILFLPSISALDFDNVVSEKELIKDAPIMIGEKEIPYNSLWTKYPVIEIDNAYGLKIPFLDNKLAELALTEHTESCSSDDCFSIFEINTYTDSALIEDVKFYTLIDDGVTLDSPREQNIRGYQFYYWGEIADYETVCKKGKTIIDIKNGTEYTPETCYENQIGSHQDWIPFNIGQVFNAGNYRVKLIGSKRPSRAVDWVITTQGKEIGIDLWATWGNISTGSQAEVRLNSPANGAIAYTNPVTLNATANVTNGAYLTNATLYDNSTGTWGARNSSNLTTFSNSGLVSYYKLDETSGTIAIDYVNNVNLTNDGATINQAGKINKSYSFDGSNDKLNRSIGNVPTGNNARSFNFWFYVTSFKAGDNVNPIISYGSASTAQQNIIDMQGANKKLRFSIDSQAPTIALNYPTALIDYGALNQSLQLNFTATDTNLDDVWYNYNGTNITIVGAVSGVTNLSNITLTTKKNVTIYANDTVGNLNTTTFSWDYKIFENSRTYNTTSYETGYETYSVNVTANSNLTAVYLNLNGTYYQATDGGNWDYSFDLPTASVGNNSVGWVFTYGGTNISSTYTTYQNVLNTVLALCNATYPTPYLNITFKDESTLGSINATMPLGEFSYYLGSGSVTKTLQNINASENTRYSFCVSPSTRTLNRTTYK
jgi:hypothetical protein